jgi:carbon-monoxide dehydrogenase medium subunit
VAIAHEFDYVKPNSLSEAVSLLTRHGAGAQVLAGGTDLVGWICDELVAPEILIDLKGIPGLAEISWGGDALSIGALATFSDLLDSAVVREKFPLILEMAGTVASPGIRNRATLVGNIASAVPCCDGGPVLLVYEADLRVTGPKGERRIPVSEWFLGPRKTVLEPGEIVTSVEMRLPAEKCGSCFVKLGRYQGADLAQASVAVLALPDHKYRVAFGAVAPTPVRARRIEALLEGRPCEPALVTSAGQLISQETAPITDVRASKEYRALMLPAMFDRGLTAAVARLEGQGPPYGERLI